MGQARVVVIGGGIAGCSVAYHLALAGSTDVLLVELERTASRARGIGLEADVTEAEEARRLTPASAPRPVRHRGDDLLDGRWHRERVSQRLP